MPFCPQCGHANALTSVKSDHLKRLVCPACDFIDYHNPKIIVGTWIVHEERVLLMQRALEPGRGFWSLPMGFLECGESMVAGAKRETREEVGLDVEVTGLLMSVDLLYLKQVHYIFKARPLAPNKPIITSESLDVRYIEKNNLPTSGPISKTVLALLKQSESTLSDAPPLQPLMYQRAQKEGDLESVL